MATKTVAKQADIIAAAMAYIRIRRLPHGVPINADDLRQIAIIPATDVQHVGEAITLLDTLAPEMAPKEPLDVGLVDWQTHKNEREHAVKYTATWEGFRLRVERKQSEDGIVFDGFINDEFIRRGKKRSVTRDEVAAEARRRLSRR